MCGIRGNGQLECDWPVDHRSCDLDICGEDRARRCPSWFQCSTWRQCWGLLTHTCRVDNHLQLHSCIFSPKSAKFHSVRQMKMKDEFINSKMHLCSSYLSSVGAAVYGQYFIWRFQAFLSAPVHREARWCMKRASTTPEHDWTLQRREFVNSLFLKGELNPALQRNCSGNLRVITSSYHFLPLSCIFFAPPPL